MPTPKPTPMPTFNVSMFVALFSPLLSPVLLLLSLFPVALGLVLDDKSVVEVGNADAVELALGVDDVDDIVGDELDNLDVSASRMKRAPLSKLPLSYVRVKWKPSSTERPSYVSGFHAYSPLFVAFSIVKCKPKE